MLGFVGYTHSLSHILLCFIFDNLLKAQKTFLAQGSISRDHRRDLALWLQIADLSLDQRLSNPNMHQNHLGGVLKQIATPRVSDS